MHLCTKSCQIQPNFDKLRHHLLDGGSIKITNKYAKFKQCITYKFICTKKKNREMFLPEGHGFVALTEAVQIPASVNQIKKKKETVDKPSVPIHAVGSRVLSPPDRQRSPPQPDPGIESDIGEESAGSTTEEKECQIRRRGRGGGRMRASTHLAGQDMLPSPLWSSRTAVVGGRRAPPSRRATYVAPSWWKKRVHRAFWAVRESGVCGTIWGVRKSEGEGGESGAPSGV